jgi:hypothetical protein
LGILVVVDLSLNRGDRLAADIDATAYNLEKYLPCASNA